MPDRPHAPASQPARRPQLPSDDDAGPWWWLVPAFAAGVGAVVLQDAHGTDSARSLVFVGGPLLLLAGLHARTEGFLHASERLRLLPYPLAPRVHWRAALRAHRAGLAATAVFGAGAVALASTTAAWPALVLVGLLADWLWLVVLAWLLEPAAVGASAWLGQRYDPESPIGRLQRQLGGGWTLPEATVHLYAPGLAIGLIAACAMPAQLWVDRLVDGLAVPAPLPAIAAGFAVLAAVARGLGGRLYARHMFTAVPWIHEASQLISGSALPPPVPRFVERWRDPATRLLLLQFWRLTPVPGLRLGLLGATVAIALASETPGPAVTASVATAILVWLVPTRRVLADGDARHSFTGALPTPARPPLVVLGLLLTPPLLAAIALVVALLR